MLQPELEYSDYINTYFLKNEYPYVETEGIKNSIKTITFQVTDACSLCCTYCYQINKSTHKLDFEDAKLFIDDLFKRRKDPNYPFSELHTPGLIIEFIGGEPLLETETIAQIIEYFEKNFSENLDSPWVLYHVYNFSSNGVAYFNPKFQELLQKYGKRIQCNITIDGCKTLHDKCRCFPDGTGSYDLAIKAALDQMERFDNFGTKMTLSPENIQYVFEGIKNMVTLGFFTINLNCIFEEGWEKKHALILYQQLELTADWLIKNNLQDSVYIALFDSQKYTPSTSESNWCGCAECMTAIDYHGDIYPCIRFMESSLGQDRKPLKIGNISHGLYKTKEEKESKKILETVAAGNTYQKSEEKCKNCSISSGCSWCTAYNYQRFGDINHRATFICLMHKAAALGSKYFYLKSNNKKDYDTINISKDEALEVIDEQEWMKLSWEGGIENGL